MKRRKNQDREKDKHSNEKKIGNFYFTEKGKESIQRVRGGIKTDRKIQDQAGEEEETSRVRGQRWYQADKKCRMPLPPI